MHPADSPNAQHLGSTFLQTYWLFQAIFAGPISAALAISAFVRLLNTHGPIYDFVTQVSNAIISAAIVFIVLIQQRLPAHQNSRKLTLRFEIAKSVLATTLWVWLMCDAAFGPQNEYDFYKRRSRVGSAAVASIVLVILFYPTVVYAVRDMQRRPAPECESLQGEIVEQTPLLRA